MRISSISLVLLFTITCFCVTSCKSDDVNEEQRVSESLSQAPNALKSAKVELVVKGDMPSWLAEKVDNMEAHIVPLAEYRVYQCTWRSHTVYYVYDNLASCKMCETYYEDGKNVSWERAADVEDFDKNSTDWKCIYVVKPK